MLTKNATSNYANGANGNGHHAESNRHHAEHAFVAREEYERLAKERDLLLQLIDSLPDSIYAKDGEGRFLVSNRKNTELLGKRCASEVIGKTDFDFYAPELAEKYHQDEVVLLNSGQDVIHAEEPNVNNLTGEKRWISTTKVVQRDKNGAPTGLFGIGRDISARKRIEEELRKSEAVFRKTANNVPSVIYQLKFEPDGSYSYSFISDRCQELYEVSAEEAMRDAMVLTKMWHPDDVAEYWRQIKHTLDNLVPLDVTVRIITPSGKIKWVRVNSIPEKQADGSIVLYGVRTDITTQKEAEARLLEQQAQMNAAADLAKLAFWEGDLQRQTFIFNEKCFALLGASVEKEGSFEISVQDYLGRFVLAEDVPDAIKHLQAVLSSPSLMRGETMYRIRRADDGGVRYIKVIYNVERNADGMPVRLFGPMQDVTEQKIAEEKLRESAVRLLEAQRVARVGDFDFDLATGELKWSEQEFEVFGVDKSVTPNFEVFVNAIHPDDRARVTTEFQTALANPSVNRLRMEFRVVHAKGEVRYTNGEVVIVRNEQGAPIRCYGTNQDITDQKVAEEKLRRSEEKFRKTVSSLPGMIYQIVFHPDGTVSYPFVSEGSRAIYGVEPEAIMQDASVITKMWHPNDIGEYMRRVEECRRTLKPFDMECRIVLPDGQIKWLHVQSTPQVEPDGSLRFYGVRTDVTKQKELEEEVARKEENFRKTVNAVPGMIYQFALLPDGTVQMPYVSEGCHDIFGLEPETIMENPMILFGMMEPEDVAASQVAIAESAANMSPFVYETRFTLPTGKQIWTRWQGKPNRREDGLIVWYGVGIDITQLKELEAELQARLKEIQETQKHLIQSEKMSALGQMVAGVAHELNTPIGYASNNVSIIRDRFKNIASLLRKAIEAQECVYNSQLEQAFAKMQEVSNSPNGTLAELDETIRRTERLFAGISSGFEQMSNLVKSMRNFSRLDEAEMKKSDINEGLRSCLLMIGHQMKDKNIELITEYGEIPMVDCYPAQLNQVFLNLIGNAIHAVEEKPDGRICVQSSLEDGYVVVRVIDNGKGIPKHVQSKIFDPFFTTKPVGKGTGLGLSICYNIVQKHNGRLYFETEEGVGTTFFVKIPAVDFLQTQS